MRTSEAGSWCLLQSDGLEWSALPEHAILCDRDVIFANVRMTHGKGKHGNTNMVKGQIALGCSHCGPDGIL